MTVKDFVIALGRKKVGLEYASIDDKKVKLILCWKNSRIVVLSS
ncbi:MAG: hypothetical protein K9N07_05780 [Candidatus Cloacimonetes bacterium]|nr:hypothetical protein [Candidatus Cloacimonadota bacterium]